MNIFFFKRKSNIKSLLGSMKALANYEIVPKTATEFRLRLSVS
jgi:hypothetical protein